MKNLTKLNHLDTKGTPIPHMPLEFGNLKCIQLLTDFVVGINSGSSINEMKNLSLMRTFSILRLQNVSKTIYAKMVNLKVKKYLRELIFKWDESAVDDLHVTHALNVLDKL
ncbi:hypothetical protein V6N13_061801 [Hibiscus sabdariffa]